MMEAPRLFPESHSSTQQFGYGAGDVNTATPHSGIEVAPDVNGLQAADWRGYRGSVPKDDPHAEEKIFVTSQDAGRWPSMCDNANCNNSAAGITPEQEPQSQRKRMLGMLPLTFYLSLSNLLFALGLLALGISYSTSKKDAVQISTEGLICPATNTTTSSSNPKICFDNNTPSTSRSMFGVARADCPRNDDLNYTVPNTNLTFTRSCKMDLTDNDLGRLPVLTMADCLAICAQMNLYPSSGQGPCLGATWVFGDTQGMGISYCYPKFNVSSKGKDRTDVESAILVSGGRASL